jgi:hypothetical protein
VKTSNWAALLVAKHKLHELITTDRQDGPYWQYMNLLAIYNVIGTVLVSMKADAYVKPEEVKQ